MAVQRRSLPHDIHVFRSMGDAAAQRQGGGPLLFDGCPPEVAGFRNAVLSDLPSGEFTSDEYCGFAPTKRARVAAAETAGLVGCARQQGRAVGSAAPSTSGRMANAAGLSQAGLLSQLYNQGVEMDALILLECERMRAVLEDSRRRHTRAVLAAVERAAAVRVRAAAVRVLAAEAELERARYRNAELEERLRQMSAESQAWLGVAKSHEAVAIGLRATLDQLLQSPCAVEGGAAQDAQSCCVEAPACGTDVDPASMAKGASLSWKVRGEGEA